MAKFLKEEFLNTYHSGVAIPLLSLVSKESHGCGDFHDLKLFGKWCAGLGLDVIQLLPLNDTGRMASPYSALSAFALHPIYFDLNELDQAILAGEEIELFKSIADQKERVDYDATLSLKMKLLLCQFDRIKEELEDHADFQEWINQNPWIRSFAAFLIQKGKSDQKPWYQWDHKYRHYSKDLEAAILDSAQDELHFLSWLQFRLDSQLKEVSSYLEGIGVFLKGDVPILMSDDSVDVWVNPKIFDMTKRAGAPPDMFAVTGQHWGFPTYNWEEMTRQAYSWWVKRLQHAASHYKLFRIDHVLGFFRIWSIPEYETTGTLGYYEPSILASLSELLSLGLDINQVEALSTSFEKGLSTKALDFLDRAKSPLSERVIRDGGSDEDLQKELFAYYRNKCLVQIEEDSFAFTWYYRVSDSFQGLDVEFQERLVKFKDSLDLESEPIWEAQGRKLLTMIKDATEMLPCAEDLGVVPNCVPEVLTDLNILSLKIERWLPADDKEESLLQHPESYPFLSVCASSVHDTDTLRGWWFDLSSEEREQFNRDLGIQKIAPKVLSPEYVEAVLERHMVSNSVLLSVAIQDLLCLSPKIYFIAPKDERINVPGTVGPHNWSYKIPMTIESLLKDDQLNDSIKALLSKRRRNRL